MSTTSVRAALVPNTSAQCVDVVLLFARGSGQNDNHELIETPLDPEFYFREKESFTFFNWHRIHFGDYYPNISYKAVSVHNFPGKYDSVGYNAAPVGLGLGNKVPNTMNADAFWVPGDYQQSVQRGTAETVGYLKDQIASCPNQYFIVGGYSQGAQVMGDALFQLTEQEQGKILGVGLFGDPKYIGSTDGLPIKADPEISFPWRRGEARSKDTGMLEPRIPYIPQNMENRTLSWCSRSDIVCAGWSALRKTSSHSAYSENPINYVVKELVNIATPQLTALERNHGGVSTEIPVIQISKADRERGRDVMFLFNDNSNVGVISTLKGVDPMLPLFLRSFGSTRFAAKSFGEHDFGFSAPRVDNIQSFLPLTGYDPSRPRSTSSNLSAAMISKYGSLLYIYGGGDLADPYQLAIERAVVSTGWSEDPNVERNIVLLVDRPPKDPYEYDICNSTVRSWLHYPDTNGPKNCYYEFNREVWQRFRAPETCEKITMVIMEDTCTNPMLQPSISHKNKRTLEDEIKLAQAYRTKISVVIPHKFDTQTYGNHKLTDPVVRDKLRHLAHATGGTFIYYDQRTQYDSTLLYDTLMQVFTKQPRSLDAVADGGGATKVLGLQTNMPAVLDVSQSSITASTYKWDFDDDGTWDETTAGPVTEHEFTTSTQGLFRVQAQGSDGAVLAETRQAYTTTLGEEPTIEQLALPEGIKAAQQADGSVLVTWPPEATNELVVFDPATNLPIGSAPLDDGMLTIPSSYDSLEIRVHSETIASEPVIVPVDAYIVPVPPIVNIEEPAGTGVEEEPCCDLQQPKQGAHEQPTIQGPGVILATTIINTPQTEPLGAILQNVSPLTTTDNTSLSVPEVAGLAVHNPPPPVSKTAALVPKTSAAKQMPLWFLILIITLAVLMIVSARQWSINRK